jgi:cyclophilin family peptidyl-prolyl cis-trans isomerase
MPSLSAYFLATFLLLSAPPEPAAQKTGDRVVLETSMGRIVLALDRQKTPNTSEHFVKLVTSGFFDGKEFYRVVAGHVIQAGDYHGKSTPPIKGEFGNPHVLGTLGLARDADPDSATTEFYICLAPRPHLDGKYAAFGSVVAGIEVVEAIGKVPVDEKIEEGVAFHKPKTPVTIVKAYFEPGS